MEQLIQLIKEDWYWWLILADGLVFAMAGIPALDLIILPYINKRNKKYEYEKRFDKYKAKYKNKIIYMANSKFWSNLNPVLETNEVAYECGTKIIKVGDDKSYFKSLIPADYITDADELDYIYDNAVDPTSMWDCDENGNNDRGISLRRPILETTGLPELRLVKSATYNSNKGTIDYIMTDGLIYSGTPVFDSISKRNTITGRVYYCPTLVSYLNTKNKELGDIYYVEDTREFYMNGYKLCDDANIYFEAEGGLKSVYE